MKECNDNGCSGMPNSSPSARRPPITLLVNRPPGSEHSLLDTQGTYSPGGAEGGGKRGRQDHSGVFSPWYVTAPDAAQCDAKDVLNLDAVLLLRLLRNHCFPLTPR